MKSIEMVFGEETFVVVRWGPVLFTGRLPVIVTGKHSTFTVGMTLNDLK